MWLLSLASASGLTHFSKRSDRASGDLWPREPRAHTGLDPGRQCTPWVPMPNRRHGNLLEGVGPRPVLRGQRSGLGSNRGLHTVLRSW